MIKGVWFALKTIRGPGKASHTFHATSAAASSRLVALATRGASVSAKRGAHGSLFRGSVLRPSRPHGGPANKTHRGSSTIA